jgi:alpha-tubulin suppressor-like RCC1 family protein
MPAGVAVWGTGSVTDVPRELTNAVAAAGGEMHALALRAEGTVVAWGDNWYGQTNVPAGLAGITAIAAGKSHSLALRVDGTVAAWGYNGNGETNVPPGLTGAVAVAAGYAHSLALRADGCVTGWGNNSYGQISVPKGLSNAVHLASGSMHSMAALTHGTVVAWGRNTSGQTNVPSWLSNVVAVAGGDSHSLALHADGRVTAWGANGNGQTNVPSSLTNAVAVAAAGNHSLALRTDGSVVTWGDNGAGLGDVPLGGSNAFAIASGLSHNMAVYRAATLTVAVTPYAAPSPPAGMNLYVSGQYVPCSVGSPVTVGSTQYVCSGWSGSGSVPASGTSNSVSFAITNASTLAWLWATNVQFTRSAGPNGNVTGATNGWYALGGSVTVTGVPNAHYHFGGWTGAVPAGQTNDNPLTLTLDRARSLTAVFAPGPYLLQVVSAYGAAAPSVGWHTNDANAVLTNSASGPVFNGSTQYACAGWTMTGNAPASGSATQFVMTVTNDAVLTWRWATNYWFSHSAGANGSVTGATNGWYALGGSVTVTGVPDAHYRFAGWTGDLSAGQTNANPLTLTMDRTRSVAASFALRPAIVCVPACLSFSGAAHSALAPQTLVVSNSGGETLNYTISASPFWLAVSNASGSLAAGAWTQHTVRVATRALVPRRYEARLTVAAPGADNTPHTVGATVSFDSPLPPTLAMAWGRMPSGGTSVPPGLTNALAAAVGYAHSLALRSDGTVVAWGSNQSGQTNVPSGLTNVLALAAGGYHSLALRADGTVAAWGSNGSGETNVPAGLSGVVAVAAGANFSLALRSNGTTAAWGENGWGQTDVPAWLTNAVDVNCGVDHALAARADGTVAAWGRNDSGQRTVPAGLSNVVAVAAGWTHSMALRDDGTVAAWGSNLYGQRSVPPSLTDVVAVACGYYHSLAVCGDGSIVAWGYNGYGQADVPAGLTNVFAAAAGGYDSLAIAPACTLLVASSCGSPVPARGTNWVIRGSRQDCSVDAQVGAGTTQYVCAGWIGSGSVPAAGVTNALSFVATNDSSLAWRWTTNYWFSRSAGLHGSVMGDTNGWYALGGSVTVTAVPDAHYHFAGWTGDVAGDTNALTMTVPIDRPRALTASFAIDQHTLTVSTPYGTAAPAGPITTNYGASVNCRVSGTEVQGSTQYVCTGAAVVGNSFTQVNPTNVTLTLTNDASLTWIWSTNYWFGRSAGPNGSVTGATNGWYALGGSVTVTGVPDAHYHFAGWTGDVPDGQTNSNPLTLALDRARSVTANFAIDWHTLTISTPYGTATPAVAVTTNYGASVNCRVSSTEVQGSTQYVCTGAAVAGNGFTQVNPTNVTLTLTNDASLTWIWSTNYWFGRSAGPNGSVTGDTNGWYALGGSVTVTGVPDAHFRLAGWTGDVPQGQTNDNPLTLTLDHPRNVAAVFVKRPVISVGPSSLAFSGGLHSVLAPQSLVVSNAGREALHYTISSSPFWIAVGSPSGSLAAGSWAQHTVRVTTCRAPVGVHRGTVRIDGDGASNSPQVVPVTVTYTAPEPPSLVAAWGSNVSGQTNVPPGIVDAVSASAGAAHSVALRSNGTVVAWGDNSLGQTNVPPGLAGVVAVSAGSWHTLALRPDGTVAAWGDNEYGQVTVPADLTNAVAVAAGNRHSLAVRSDGTVAVWGYNSDGQTNVPAGLSNVAAVAAAGHCLALRGDGTVAAWGLNQFGQRDVPAGLSNVVAVAAGAVHSLALRADGTVAAWGWDYYGQCEVPVGLTDAVAIAAGNGHSLALRADGSIAGWGDGWYGELSVPAGVSNFFAVAAGGYHSLGLWSAARLTVAPQSFGAPSPPVGTNWYVRGAGVDCSVASPVVIGSTQFVCTGWTGTGSVPASGATNAVSFAITNESSLAWQWATNWWEELAPTPEALWFTGQVYSAVAPQTLVVSNAGSGTLDYTITPSVFWLSVEEASGSLAAGAWTQHTVRVATRGLAARRHVGRLTIADVGAVEIPRVVPVTLTLAPPAPPTAVAMWGAGLAAPEGLANAVSVAVGSQHALALRSDGTVAAWGSNYVGETDVPADLTNAVVVAAGSIRSFAVRADGTVARWGASLPGQAEAWAQLADVASVAAGRDHALAVRRDGTVVAWGHNTFGQTNVPAEVTDVVEVAGGLGHSLVLRADGTVVAWGDNWGGQTNVPPGLTGVVAVAAGTAHSLALQADGTVVGWGWNDWGQCSVPPSLSNAVAIAAGEYHSAALRADGTVLAWGGNSYGESSVPTEITNAFALSARGTWNLAVFPAARLTVAPSPYSLPVPAAGTHIRGLGRLVDCAIPSPVALGSTQYVCTGWTGTGSVPASGASNSVSFVITNDSTIAWLWATNADPAPAIAFAPDLMAFSGTVHTALAPQTLVVSNSGVAILNYTIASSPFWIAVSNASGSLAGGAWTQHVVRVATRGLDQRTYHGNLTIAAIGCANSPQNVPVGVTFAAPESPTRPWAWGLGTLGRTDVPQELSDVVTVAGGGFHSAAVRSDGSVVAWGDNSEGQTNVPAGCAEGVAVACGWLHSLAMRADGSVVAWGESDYGKTSVPADVSNAVAVAAGESHSLALLSDGTVRGWGGNNSGQANVPFGLSNAVSVAAGASHSLAARSGGTVVAWGYNGFGQCTVPPELSNVVTVAAGWLHSVALCADGGVAAWGGNAYGQCDVPAGLTDAVAVACGNDYSLALRANGSVIGWGDNRYGQTTVPPDIAGAFAVAAGGDHALALCPAARLLVQPQPFGAPSPAPGSNWYARGVTVSCSVLSPVVIASTQLVCTGWTGTGSVPAGGATNSVTFAITNESSITWRWATNWWKELAPRPEALAFTGLVYSAIAPQTLAVSNAGSETLNYTIAPSVFWLSVETGSGSLAAGVWTQHTVRVATRGLNVREYHARLTITDVLGAEIPRVVPVTLTLTPPAPPTVVSAWGTAPTNMPAWMTDAVAIAVDGHALALRSNGTVVGWGGSEHDGEANVPQGLTNIVAIAAGAARSLALRENGTVAAWGGGLGGQTEALASLTDAEAVVCGGSHSLALRGDGSVRVWGYTEWGQTAVPPELTNAVDLAAGTGHSVGLRADGRVFAWGLNTDGQIEVPPGLSNVVAVAAGGDHSLALRSDGTVVAWGENAYGQRSVPPGLSNVVAVSAGAFHSQALREDGTVVAWGADNMGQLSVPSGLTGAFAMDAGWSCGMALWPAATLVVEPSAYGTPDPPVGTNQYARGVLTCTIDSPIDSGATQYVCIGWTGIGDVPASGASNHVSFAFTEDSAIAWLWGTNYWFARSVGGKGSLSGATSGWYALGGGVTVTGVPDAYYHFAGWTGDVPAGQTNQNPLGLAMDQARAATAGFAANLTPRGTPEWWLAAYGLTSLPFDQEELLDRDGDGAAAWQESIADTDPTNGQSVLGMIDVAWEADGIRVRWKGGANAVQYIEAKESLLPTDAPWRPLFTNPPPTTMTNSLLDAGRTNLIRFYRVRASRP